MIQGKLLSYGDDLKEVFEIRKKVFVEELGIPEDIEFDEYDNEAIHVLVYEKENNAVATGRIVYCEDYCIIDKIAVMKQFRNKEYGDFTVRMLINRAFTAGIDKVRVETKAELITFFEKIGFHIEDDKKKAAIKMIIDIKDMKTCCNK